MSSVREKWNRRYAEKTGSLASVPAAITQGWQQLKPGSVLDLASGDGGSSLYLAQQGFAVTAVDIAEEGLKRLALSAKEHQLSIRTLQCDLDDVQGLKQLGRYDNIVINRFRPSPLLFACLPDLLTLEGKLMLNSFNLRQHQEKGFSERFCLLQGEYLEVTSNFRVEYYRSLEREGDFMDEYLFTREG
ncbi:methyltransferase domain-containing protein [Neptunomonas japonica]|uniref:Tellurite methyltransferase n=1 Tax=Neptunomonas japonica JAMM 1380 TaxID=1441457 RepID=A0A7R6P9B3_9GAMM|nr:methyltransferase domain-containing protein [Neptunomonas japonica]BBB29629.1 tellurite methyltransferase [Neptunomonas japonica JAMM 1380]